MQFLETVDIVLDKVRAAGESRRPVSAEGVARTSCRSDRSLILWDTVEDEIPVSHHKKIIARPMKLAALVMELIRP